MSDQYFVSCVVPARNEEGNIAGVIDALSTVLSSAHNIGDYEIVVVDDNSTDTTGVLIDAFAQKDNHIRPVHRTSAPGFGNAIKAGMAEARGDIVIPFMGDLSDDPHDIPRLVERIHEGYDIAYGSRFVEGGELRGYPQAKMIANRAFNNLVRFSFGIPYRDITNAFKAYRKEVLDAISIENLESSGFDITVETPIKAHILGFQSSEVPVSWSDRTAGEAKLKLSRNGTVYGKRFLKLFFYGNLVTLKDILHYFVKGSWIGIFLAVILGIFLLAFLFTLTGFSEIFHLLINTSGPWILLCCSAILVSFFVRTWRWSVLLRSAGYVYPRDTLFKCLMFSWFLNYIVPARLGDVARGVALKMTAKAPLGMTLSTIVIERILDLVTLALFLLIASGLFYNESFVYIEAGVIVIVATLLCLLLVIYKYDQKIVALFEHRIPSIQQSVALLKDGLDNISRNPQAMVLCFALSIPVWFLEIVSIFFAAKSVGFELPFASAAIAGVVAFTAQALPVTPAGLGIHEASIVGILLLFSVPNAIGLSIALIDHFARGAVIIIFGLIATVHIGFASRWFFKEKQDVQERTTFEGE